MSTGLPAGGISLTVPPTWATCRLPCPRSWQCSVSEGPFLQTTWAPAHTQSGPPRVWPRGHSRPNSSPRPPSPRLRGPLLLNLGSATCLALGMGQVANTCFFGVFPDNAVSKTGALSSSWAKNPRELEGSLSPRIQNKQRIRGSVSCGPSDDAHTGFRSRLAPKAEIGTN